MLSRVADNLYWMSRYLERAEHTARLLDVNLDMILDLPPGEGLAYWSHLFASLNIPLSRTTLEANEAYAMTQRVAFDPTHPNSLISCIASARENARQVREQISSEMWEQINRMYLYAKTTRLDHIWHKEPHRFFLDVKDGAHLFQGITDGTMNHNQGWQFIQVGRFIERSTATATLLDVHYRAFYQGEHHDNYQDWVALLKSCTAFEAYCKVHTADLVPETIAEFLLLDEGFPHAVLFSVNCMQSALRNIAELVQARKTGRINRLAGRLQSTLEYSQIDEVMGGDFHAYMLDIREQCRQLHQAIYETYIEYPIDQEVLS